MGYEPGVVNVCKGYVEDSDFHYKPVTLKNLFRDLEYKEASKQASKQTKNRKNPTQSNRTKKKV